MMMYLINFVLCSGLLLMVYKLFLQGERMYRFNRFYLLFSLVFSLIVPAITLRILPRQLLIYHTTVSNQPVQAASLNPGQLQVIDQLVATKVNQPGNQHTLQTVVYDYLPVALLIIYGIVTIAMLFRFIKNSYQIYHTATKGTAQFDHHTRMVLVDDEVTPHSFLNWVFINKKDYHDGAIEPEIICHEQAHVNQLHSLDVIIVELLQAICWFNLFIPLYRKAIQLNHEFLADDAVIQHYQNTPAYQCLLLAKASAQGSIYLTSQFNYLTTKKRLLMMTKTTSAKIALGKQLIVLPVIAAAVFLFSQKTEAKILPAFLTPVIPAPVKAVKDTTRGVMHFAIPKAYRIKYSATDAPQKVIDAYTGFLKKYDIMPDGDGKVSAISTEDKARMHELFTQMSKQQQDSFYVRFEKAFKPVPKSTITASQLEKWQDAKKYGVWVDDKRVKNATLANYKPDDFDNLMFSNLTPLAVKNDGFHYQVNLMTKAYYADYYKKTMANQDDRLDHWHIVRPKK
ncbi:MAG: hypothetical protein V4592_11740 [Bacteroidota bacterium]